MSFVSIEGDLDEVRGIGERVRGIGIDHDAATQDLTSKITDAESGAPWGGDSYGEEFKKSYFKDFDGKPAHELVKSNATATGKRISDTGGAISGAMTDLQLSDMENNSELSSVEHT